MNPLAQGKTSKDDPFPDPDVGVLDFKVGERLVKVDPNGPGPERLPPIRRLTEALGGELIIWSGDIFSIGRRRFGVPVVFGEIDEVEGRFIYTQSHPLPFDQLGPGSDDGFYVPEAYKDVYKENKRIYIQTLRDLVQTLAMKETTLLDQDYGGAPATVKDWKWDGDTFSLVLETDGIEGNAERLILFLDQKQRPTLAYYSYMSNKWVTLTPPNRAVEDAALEEFNNRKRKADEPLYDDRPAQMPRGDD